MKYLVGLFLLFSLAAYAQAPRSDRVDIGTMKGETLTIYAAGCLKRPEADHLLAHVRHGGPPEAIAYMNRQDNSCSIGLIRARLGAIVHSVSIAGMQWVIMSITSPDGKSHAFLVTPRMVKPPGLPV